MPVQRSALQHTSCWCAGRPRLPLLRQHQARPPQQLRVLCAGLRQWHLCPKVPRPRMQRVPVPQPLLLSKELSCQPRWPLHAIPAAFLHVPWPYKDLNMMQVPMASSCCTHMVISTLKTSIYTSGLAAGRHGSHCLRRCYCGRNTRHALPLNAMSCQVSAHRTSSTARCQRSAGRQVCYVCIFVSATLIPCSTWSTITGQLSETWQERREDRSHLFCVLVMIPLERFLGWMHEVRPHTPVGLCEHDAGHVGAVRLAVNLQTGS